MRLAIIEPEHRLGSHHCNYVYAVAREAIRMGWKLCLISSEGEASHPVLSRVRQESGTDIKAICCQKVGFPSRPSAMTLLRYQYQQYRVLSYAYEALKSFQADVIYLNSLDTCDKMISLFGSPCADTPLAGMLLAPKFHHSRLGVIGSASRFNRAAELSFKRLLRLKTFRALLTIDEL